MVWEHIFGPMGVNMRVTGRMGNEMELEHTSGSAGTNTPVDGKMGHAMVKALMIGLMAENM